MAEVGGSEGLDGVGKEHVQQESVKAEAEVAEAQFRFPPADLIFSPKKEAEVKALKKTFSRPTKEGVVSIFNDLQKEREDIPEEVSNALTEWFSRSWWEWYDEKGIKNPKSYEAEVQGVNVDDYTDLRPNPLCSERGTHAAIQELVIRAGIKGRELLPLEQAFIGELLRVSSEAYAAQEQTYDALSARLADPNFELNGIADKDLHPTDWRIYQEHGRLPALKAVTDKKVAFGREKEQFALLKAQGIPLMLDFFKRYSALGEKGRTDMRSSTVAPARDISILVKAA